MDVVFPIFSLKELDVYQVAASAPLPSPSSIVGALGAAMGRLGLCRGVQCMEEARRSVRVARPVAAGPLVKSPIVLRRLRGVLEERRVPEGLGGFVKFSDAMSREYVFTHFLRLLVVGDVDPRALYLIDRLGDSESLAAVLAVRSFSRAERCDGGVNVAVVREVARGGGFTLVKMLDEGGSPRVFALPVVRSGGDVYEPSLIEVGGEVLCVGDVRFPGGHGW